MLLVGCSVPPRPVDVGAIPDDRTARLLRIASWYCAGRFSYRGESETASGRFEWQRSPARESLLLSDPVGRGVLRVTRSGNSARMVTAQGEVSEAADIGQLLDRVAGAAIPVGSLRFWLLGVPDPAVEAFRVTVDEEGLPIALEQSGWIMSYSRYTDSVGVSVPAKLEARGPGITLRLIVSDWKLDGSE